MSIREINNKVYEIIEYTVFHGAIVSDTDGTYYYNPGGKIPQVKNMLLPVICWDNYLNMCNAGKEWKSKYGYDTDNRVACVDCLGWCRSKTKPYRVWVYSRNACQHTKGL